MKKTVMVICLMLTQSAIGLTPIGNPTVKSGHDGWQATFNYLHSSQDVELYGYGLTTTGDITVNNFLGEIGGNVTEDWYLGFLMGLGRSDIDNVEFIGVTVGARARHTFIRKEKVDWSSSINVFLSNFAEDVSLPGFHQKAEIDVTYMEMTVAIGPVLHVTDDVDLYGGLGFHYLSGTVDVNAPGSKLSFDIEKDFSLGGFIGLSVEMSEHSSFDIEAQLFEDAKAISFRFNYRF